MGVQAVGCSINQSSGSMLSEAVVGKTTEQIQHLATTFEGIMNGQSPSPTDDAADMYDLPTLSAVQRVPGADQVRAAVVVGAGGRAEWVWSTVSDFAIVHTLL